MKKIRILGYSGHSYEIIEILQFQKFIIDGYFEIEKKNFDPYSLKYLGNENQTLFEKLLLNKFFFVCIGKNSTRLKLSEIILKKGGILPNVIHNTASISKFFELGQGNFISKNVSVNSNTRILNHNIINTSAVIEHNCSIDNGVHIGPGVVLCGNVIIKSGAFIGANSVVKENIIIGENSIIGAGSVVLKNVPKNQIHYGNPSKKAKKQQ